MVTLQDGDGSKRAGVQLRFAVARRDAEAVRLMVAGCLRCEGTGRIGLLGPRGFGLIPRGCPECSGSGFGPGALNIEDRGPAGDTALHAATAWPCTDGILALLLEARADIEARDCIGCTALLCAARAGHKGTVAILVDAGADVDAKSHDGSTALIFAAGAGHADLVEFLLDVGVDAESKADSGATALIEARRSANIDIERMILTDPRILLLTLHFGVANPDGFSEVSFTNISGHECASVQVDLSKPLSECVGVLRREFGGQRFRLMLSSGHVLTDEDGNRPLAFFDGIPEDSLLASALQRHG